jgi:hypothetical protein
MSKQKIKVTSTPIKTPKGMPTTLYISRLHSDVSTSMEVSIEKIKHVIELLKTDENLKMVLDGIVGSVTEKLEIPIGHIPYFTRQMGIEMGKSAPKYCVINSIFNREPFLTDENTLVKKTAYLIRYMYSVDDFNEFPLSLIADPSDNDEAGFQMTDVLLAKDRGHFITVLYDLVHNNTSYNKSFWNKVKNRLAELTTKGKSTPLLLKNFQETIIENILSNSTSDELTLKDIVPINYFNKIYSHKETLKVRLETIATHKSEISGINDEENKWMAHNYGLSDLTADFIKNKYYDFNITLIEKECSKSDTLLGKTYFLSSRNKANFSGFETEPVFILLANRNKTIEDKTIYSSLAGTDKDNRGKDYSDSILHQLKTQDAKEVITKLNTTSNLTYLDTQNSLWLTFNDAISQSEANWIEMRKSKDQGIQNGHFAKLKSGPMDTALFYYFTGDYLVSKLGHRTGVTTPSVALKQFIEWWIEEINTNQNKFWQLIEKVSKSWSGRYEMWMDYVKSYIKHKESEDGKTISPTSLRKSKLLELRQVYSEKQWSHNGKMYDRTSNGWTIVDYDLTTGKGFNVCHYMPDTLGGRYTHENTDIGPEFDNKQIVKNNVIPTDYFGTNGDFYKKFKEEVNQPEFDSEEAAVYLNTMNLAKAYDIIYNKRKQLNESISNT